MSVRSHSAFRQARRPRLALTLVAVFAAVPMLLQAQTSTSGSPSTAAGNGATAVSGQAGSAPADLSPAPNAQDTAPLQISSGDLLDIEVFDTPELSASKARVSQDGLVQMPVVGDINVSGLSPLQAAVKIETTLRQKQIMLQPHVTVLVNEYASQGVRVLGQVRTPGTYTLLGQHSLLDALSAAGGTTPDQGGTITITHAQDLAHPEVLSVYASKNSEIERHTQVRAGDVVVVSRADPFYVTGDVGAPGQYFIGNGRPLRLVEGIALARGVTATAALTHASILRKTENGTIRIPINLRRVEKNTDPDPLLEADDIVIVPRSELKQIAQFAVPYATGIILGSVVANVIK